MSGTAHADTAPQSLCATGPGRCDRPDPHGRGSVKVLAPIIGTYSALLMVGRVIGAERSAHTGHRLPLRRSGDNPSNVTTGCCKKG